MSVVQGYMIGSKLLKVLGIPDEEVSKFTLICPANGIVEVIVKRYVSEAQGNEITAILEEYTICKEEEG